MTNAYVILPAIGGLVAVFFIAVLFLTVARRLERRIDRLVGPGSGARCPRCLYDFSGIDALVCPECGRASDGAERVGSARRHFVLRVGAVLCWAMGGLALLGAPAALAIAAFWAIG